MITQIPTLYLALAALIGIFIGLLVASLFNNKENQPQKKEPPRDIVKEGYGEVARLWYTPAGKKILMEIDGGHYRDFKNLNREQQAKALRLAELLNKWTGREPLPETETQPASAIYQPIMQEQKSEESAFEYTEPETQQAPAKYQPIIQDKKFAEPAFEYQEPEETFTNEPFIERTVEAAPAAEVGPFTTEEDDADVVSVLQQSLDEEETSDVDDSSPNVTLSITQQIGAILDEMVKGTDLEDKNIKLIENEENGVDVCVGVEVYPGIDSVPYPLVKQMIHDAVVRWEQENESQQRMEM